jgi:reverse gyrase
MSPEQFAQLLQAISNDSIWKIVLGAVLAVAGGFLAKLWDEWRARLIRRNAVYTFGIDVLDSYSATFSELVEYQGQTGTIWLAILERITEEYSAFSRNREHLILINDTTLRRDIQSTILKVHGTANLLKVSVVDEQTKQNAHAPQAELEAAARMTRHRFDQLRHQIDQARDLRQRLASGHPR